MPWAGRIQSFYQQKATRQKSVKVYVEDILAAPIASPSVENRSIRRSIINNQRLATRCRLTRCTLLLADGVALCTVINILIISSLLLGLSLPALSALTSSFLLFPLAYMSFGLYRPVTIRPEREILAFSKANLAVIAGLSVPVLFVPQFRVHMVLWLCVAAPLLILIVPFFRVLTRIMFARANWWGESALILGSGQEGLDAITAIQRAPELGLKPAALLQDDLVLQKRMAIPAFASLNLYHSLAKTHGISHVVLAMTPEEEAAFMKEHEAAPIFKYIYVTRRNSEGLLYLKGLTGNRIAGLGCTTSEWWRMIRNSVKRTADIIGASVGIILLAPLFAAITLLNKLTSQGPVFFTQDRMGKNGRLFKVYKFRTMHMDAERKLQHILETDPVSHDNASRPHTQTHPVIWI